LLRAISPIVSDTGQSAPEALSMIFWMVPGCNGYPEGRFAQLFNIVATHLPDRGLRWNQDLLFVGLVPLLTAFFTFTLYLICSRFFLLQGGSEIIYLRARAIRPQFCGLYLKHNHQ
jgi:hypothetical protein